MALPRDLARRSRAEWMVRIGLAVVVAIVAYFGITFSIAQTVVRSNPTLAYRLAPYDGRLTAIYAASLAVDGATPQDRRRADELARHALRQEPMAVAALSTLGIDADFRNDQVAARRLFTGTQRLSRRSLPTQLWMIQDAVTRGSVRQAIHQYDITLRVFPDAGALLYPILASASGEPAIRQELVRTLAVKPAWAPSFISFLAAKGEDPTAVASLFVTLQNAGMPIPEAAQTDVINRLMVTDRFDAAWAYYVAVRPGVDRRYSRDPRFATKLETPSQLDWVALNDGGLATTIQGGIFEFSAPASVGGPLIQQLQLLPSGAYRLTGHSIGLDMPANAQPYWSLLCRGGRELGRVEMPNSDHANGEFSGTFTVPADCPAQILVLYAKPSDAVAGLSGQMDRVRLVPAGR